MTHPWVTQKFEEKVDKKVFIQIKGIIVVFKLKNN